MLFLALIIFAVSWVPFRWFLLPSISTMAAWPVLAQSGVFYLICLVTAWLVIRLLASGSPERLRVVHRATRLAGTRGISLLLFLIAAASLLLGLFGVSMAAWYLGAMLPVAIVGGLGFIGFDLRPAPTSGDGRTIHRDVADMRGNVGLATAGARAPAALRTGRVVPRGHREPHPPVQGEAEAERVGRADLKSPRGD